MYQLIRRKERSEDALFFLVKQRRYKLASRANLYRFTDFCKIACWLQQPQSPLNSIEDAGFFLLPQLLKKKNSPMRGMELTPMVSVYYYNQHHQSLNRIRYLQ